jgi:hypothetical protein
VAEVLQEVYSHRISKCSHYFCINTFKLFVKEHVHSFTRQKYPFIVVNCVWWFNLCGNTATTSIVVGLIVEIKMEACRNIQYQ